MVLDLAIGIGGWERGLLATRAEERKPSFLVQARTNDELRVKSEAICSRWEEQGAKRRSDGAAPKDMLAWNNTK